MKILILPDDKFNCLSSDKPKEGKYYYLEDATTGTQAQNKAAHGLMQEYWKSGLHAKYGGDDFATFRDKLKRDLGEGFESYVYADIINGMARIFKVKSWEDIPEHIRRDSNLKEIIQGKLKSWTDYTLKQRMKFIDNLIDDGTAAGVKSKKWFEIIEGMQEGKNEFTYSIIL